jgi:hypothetical protein
VPFAVRRLVTALALALLGIAAAVLVACGDSNGLIPGDEASSLRNALDGVQSACANGQLARAEASAARFERNVAQLTAADVDRRLIRTLRDGADRLQQVVARECATVTETIETQTEAIEPATTPTATTPPPVTTPTQTPTTPGDGTPTTPSDQGDGTTPSDGGGATPPSDDGGGAAPPDGGQSPSDQGASPNTPDVNRGTPGGALAPGQGGTE